MSADSDFEELTMSFSYGDDFDDDYDEDFEDDFDDYEEDDEALDEFDDDADLYYDDVFLTKSVDCAYSELCVEKTQKLTAVCRNIVEILLLLFCSFANDLFEIGKRT